MLALLELLVIAGVTAASAVALPLLVHSLIRQADIISAENRRHGIYPPPSLLSKLIRRILNHDKRRA